MKRNNQVSPVTLLIALLAAFVLTACSTTQQVTMDSSVHDFHPQSAYFVPHLKNSGDMDGYIQTQLFAHEIKSQSGPDVRKLDGVDMLVKYSDSWTWDITMYLNTLDISFYDAKSGTVVVMGHWSNSSLHGFPDASDVVKGVIEEMFTKLNQTSSTTSTTSADPANSANFAKITQE